MRKYIFSVLLTGLVIIHTGCKKFVEVSPPITEIVTTEAFKEDASATSAVLGIYINILSERSFLNSGISVYSAMAADETTDFTNNAENLQFQQNLIAPTNSVIASMWASAYQNMLLVNTCIDGLQQSTSLTAAVKKQLLGECRFSRAFINFYLVNLWGKIPLVTSANYKENAVIGQSAEEDVYQSMINDLKAADTLLTEAYPTEEKARPNKWTAHALLARVYLYHKEYANAESEASAVIGSNAYGPLPDLNGTFLKSSAETIWQLMPSQNLQLTTDEGNIFIGDIMYGSGPNYPITPALIASFETDDQRKTTWIDTITYGNTLYYYPFKYKDRGSYGVAPSEYYVMFRLSEQYMIRAEASAQLKKLNESVADVNVIRSRAGLDDVTAEMPSLTQENLLTAIANENRHEFFAEWGHRWLDLKRTGKADAVLSAEKPTWLPTAVWFPLPQAELDINKKLKQNLGYN
jgi:hypothetical protein